VKKSAPIHLHRVFGEHRGCGVKQLFASLLGLEPPVAGHVAPLPILGRGLPAAGPLRCQLYPSTNESSLVTLSVP
jgi:hypothetical protein